MGEELACTPCTPERKNTGICQNAYDTLLTLRRIEISLKEFRQIVLGDEPISEDINEPKCLEENVAMCSYMATDIEKELDRIKGMF